jgi:hypothetical protein
MKWTYSVNLSTISIIISLPLDFGNPIIKSISIIDQVYVGIGKGYNNSGYKHVHFWSIDKYCKIEYKSEHPILDWIRRNIDAICGK